MDDTDHSLINMFLMCVILALAVETTGKQISFSIDEERPIGSFVGNVSATPIFLTDIPVREKGYITYSFLQQNSIQNLLSFYNSSGVLTTAVVIDRESRSVCLSLSMCSFTFDIALRSARPQSSYFDIISVTLIIRDINDNAPQFPNDVVSLEISESIIPGASFVIESAVDLDSGIYSVQHYEIEQQDGNFSLDVVKKLDGDFTVKLILNSLLDREIKDRYSLVIIAMDGGNPKLFGAVSVNITVTDINDNAPVFLKPSYNISVQENITVGSTILTVFATDKDIGKNGEVYYRFSQNQLDARVYDLFAVSAFNGDLILKNKLVYNSDRLYKIIVEATDSGSQPHVTQVIVSVNIIDVGNNPPMLQINLLSLTNSRIVNISEAANNGTFVAHVNVIDKDTGANGEIECGISDHKFTLISMGNKGYKVIVNWKLDRETQDLHQILVSCHDFGKPPLNASSSFLVSLDDINDCAPIFTQPIFTGETPENDINYKTFVQITAFDKDLGMNAQVRYCIDEISTPYKFWIDPISGKLQANQTFDRETTPEIVFKVIASDLGNPSLSSKVLVKLTILDRNDNAPTITDPRRFRIEENKMSDSVVGKLNAVDLDAGENARVMFVMSSEFEYFIPFVVFPDGTIKTNRQLDREVEKQFNFTIVAFNQGSIHLSSTANITVDVADANDNYPILFFPNRKNNTIAVFSNFNLGQEVTKIEAADLDEGINAILSYDIIDGNYEDLFVIDHKLGGIYLTKKIAVNQNKSFHLKIAVKDGAQAPLTTESILNILFIKAMNSTGLPPGNGHENNTTIVIVVVILTVILSIIMIIVICFLKHFDHRSKTSQKHLHVVAPDEKYPKFYMDNGSRFLDTCNTNCQRLKFSYDPMSSILCTKKKVVSFDVAEQLENGDLRDNHSTTMTTFVAQDKEKLPPLSNHDDSEETVDQMGHLNKLQLLQYHQGILESETNTWLKAQGGHEQERSSFEITLPDDDRSSDVSTSDTSGEVTASDSGKGGSEDDTPSNHSKDMKQRINGGVKPVKFQTHHYVAPEFRRQGSLQRKACNINCDDLNTFSPTSPDEDEVFCRTETSLKTAHSASHPNSHTELNYLQVDHQTLDETDQLATEVASYV